MSWASYMDATYGGPVHGKGFCFPTGIMPAYNIPDAEGNAPRPGEWLFFRTNGVAQGEEAESEDVRTWGSRQNMRKKIIKRGAEDVILVQDRCRATLFIILC